MKRGPFKPGLLAPSLIVLAASIAYPAHAQTNSSSGLAPQSSEEASNDAIIVTGSRLARSTFDTATPVTVMGSEELERLQVTNIGQIVSLLPAFRPSNNPTTNGFGSFNVGAQIVNLRGLGVLRNLVLVDGRRFAPTTREGSVDLNFIPSILVERTEVVTGGASAAYGSDALAGVVNVTLDKQLQGLKLQIDQSITEHGDGRNFHAAAAYGTSFAGGAGHLIMGVEYSDQQQIDNCFTRSWCKPAMVVTNPGYAAGNGMPNLVRSDDNAGYLFSPAGVVSRFYNTSPWMSGVANLAGTGGITFAPDGGVQPFRPGTVGSGLYHIGGDIYSSFNDSLIMVPVERYTGFAHADYDFSDSLSGFIEGSYGNVDGAAFQTAYFSPAIAIQRDNAFLPQAIRNQLTLSGPPPGAPAFLMGKVFDDVARAYARSKADVYRFTTGLKGAINDRFSWDFYYQYGRTDRLQTVANNIVTANLTRAIDAVNDPVTNLPTCRALISTDAAVRAAAAGCVPINLFGAGNVTQEGKDYIYGTLREDLRMQQHVIAANMRGSTSDLLAGPLSFAFGGEYRIDKINVTHDPLSNSFAYFQNFGADFNGKTEVIEGYIEAELPILADVPFFQRLTINGAVRQAHYKTNGFGSYLRATADNSFDATTWKVSLNWAPTNWLRLRATQSRDVRAPNFAELFLSTASSFSQILNPFVVVNGNATTNNPVLRGGGSPFLRPEKADTTTLGLVFDGSDGVLDGFRFSADAYRIKIKDYIGTAPGGAQFLVNRCFAGVAAACALVERDPVTGNLVTILTTTTNLDSITTQGIDFEAHYRTRVGEASQLTLSGIATHVDKLETVSYGQAIDRAGQTGNAAAAGAPDWIINGTINYATPGWSLTLQGRYIPSGTLDAQYIAPGDPGYAPTAVNSINDNRVDARFYTNVFGSVFVGEDRRFELFGSVNNLLNKAPPAAPELQFYTNPVYFDTVGRSYRIGVRMRL